MKRISVVALAAAAVIGTTGGVTLAVTSGGEQKDPPAAGESKQSGSGTPDDSGSTDQPKRSTEPLYYADGAIHDGSKNVSVPTEVASGDVIDLAEVEGGWLITQVDTDTSGDPYYTGTYVPESGEAWRIGEWRGNPDVTAERDRLVYGNGVTWHVATFADRTTEPLDILDGKGKEPPYMEVVNSLPGIAITASGLVTGWEDGKTNRLVETEQKGWTHEKWGTTDVDVPITSPDGTQAVAAYRNVDYEPENPVGDCLTGGAADDPGSWWQECEIGAASLEPWSPSGEQLLIRGTSSDGPGTSWVRVVDPLTGEKQSQFDPGGLLSGAEWSDETSVFTLSQNDDSSGGVIKKCDTGTEKCEVVQRTSDNAVLGSR